jgi:rhamnulokinase
MTPKNLLAFDLGAESGRGILGHFDGQQLTLEVIHRFPNGPVRVADHLYWDVLRLYGEMKETLRLCAGRGSLDSVGIDTWGVDFGLLGQGDVLLGNPRHYRDPHTEGVMEAAFQRVPAAEVFRQTGIQFMRFNTLFQLLALQRESSPILEHARSFLMMPDLFHFWLCGTKANEFTNASTTQCLDPHARQWATPLLQQLGLRSDLFGTIVPPGTRLGELRPAVQQEMGVGPVPVIAPATHDTGAAVAAVPAEGENWCYLSSGTWSLMGVELSQPCINEEVRAANFTNEGGYGGTTRFLKNIMGLWLVQECRRAWEQQGQKYSYDDLTRLAAEASPFQTLINPDDAAFLLPAHMPAAIAAYAVQTKQPAPATPGAFIRCCLESLALRYRWVVEKLEELTGKQIAVIHILGGGSQNRLLNQMTADACGRLVLAGPVEATALGNLATQAIGLGLLSSLAEARQLIRRSFPLERFEPNREGRWEAAYQRFTKFLEGT